MLAQICIFVILLFIYVHVRYHIRPGTDQIIYELADPSRDLLHETIHHKQPVKFHTEMELTLQLNWKELLNANKSQNVNVGMEQTSVPVNGLIDVSDNVLLQSNQQFFADIDITDVFGAMQSMFRPHMMTRVSYDLIGNYGKGSANIHTHPTSSSAHITYLVCTSGTAKVRLCSGKYTKRLCRDTSVEPKVSHISFWDNSGNLANEELFAQIKSLDTTLVPNQTIAIPAHWWYSVDLSPHTNIAVYGYRSIMNELACLPETIRSLL